LIGDIFPISMEKYSKVFLTLVIEVESG
jgi:hypothetical protein